MTEETQTSAIDDKKETTAPPDPGSETKTFFINLSKNLLYLLIVIVVGAAILWSARVAQTNLMPTDLACAPFTMSQVNINKGKPVCVNIDVVKMKNEEGKNEIKSTKIEFDINENMNFVKYGIFGINYIRYLTDSSDSNPYTLFIGTIQQKMYVNYSSMINSFYNILNQNCSESVIIFIIPLIFSYIISGITIINYIYGIILWFTNLYLLFSTQTDCYQEPMVGADGMPILDDNGIPMTKNGKIWGSEPGEMWRQWYWAIFYIILSFILITFIFLIITILLIINTFSCLFLPLSIVAKIKGSPDEKPYTFSTLLGNILKYKMSVIMYIISYFLITDASSIFGGIGAFVAIIACIFIYSFYPNIYQQYIPTDSTPTIGLESYNQAQKFCKGDFTPADFCDITHPRTWTEWFYGENSPTSVGSMAVAQPVSVYDLKLLSKKTEIYEPPATPIATPVTTPVTTPIATPIAVPSAPPAPPAPEPIARATPTGSTKLI